MSPPLSSFLYSSRLAPSCRPTEVGGIVKKAREVNAHYGITGVLVFDGEMFAQYFEGPTAQVNVLISKVQSDSRHVEFRQLFSSTQLHQRLFSHWSMGYSDNAVDGLDIEQLRVMPAEDAFRAFADATPKLDIL